LEVFIERGVGGGGPQHALPGVPVGVDEAGEHEVVPCVDDLGALGGQARADRGDHAVLDEQVGRGRGVRRGVGVDDEPALDQDARDGLYLSRKLF
jgi:hypothetical protein